MPVFFHIEDIQFSFNRRRQYKNWISHNVKRHNKELGAINIIFTSNDYLLSINQQYLNHNYYTDVITFDYNEENLISGDIFVSLEQVKINSEEIGNAIEEELSRVVIHGVLHLLGFNDTSPEEIKRMRREEEKALELFNMAE
ncbi:rRNA maturation RNase YbeY [Bacteroidota bacterium]